MKRVAGGLATIILLLGCEDGLVSDDRGVTANQIERISTPKEDPRPPDLVERLQPITGADLERGGLVGARCDFSSGGRQLLVAVSGGGLVRFGPHLVRLIAAGPVGPTGGFFEDRRVSVSVGRLSEEGDTAGETASWPARAIVTNRRTDVENEIQGVWTCGA